MLLAFLFIILAVTKPSFCTETEQNVISGIQNSMPANSSMPPILDATASKLIRYRSKPPPNFFRHKSQPQKRSRPRIVNKSPPKMKNNRPMFTQHHFEQSLQPSSYYKFKPEVHESTLAYKPSYSYDEVHYEISSEYPKKESNYETQAMDLDFYGETYPKKKVVSQYEYSKPQKGYSKPQKFAPQYEFTKPQKTYSIHRPQNFFEAPQESYDFNFGSKPEVHYEISYHEESPAPAPVPAEPVYEPVPQPKQKFVEDFAPYGAPPKKIHQSEQVSYQIPDNKYEAPSNPYHSQELPSKEVNIQSYDKKLTNSGYNYNNDFGEPPTDIHIIHSPSYDIETLPKKHAPPPKNTYAQPHETYGPPPSDNYGPPNNVYGPPPVEYNKKPPPSHHGPIDSYHQSNSGQFAEPPGSYLPPPHLTEDLPLNKNHMPPGYDYPKSSYEVPLYDPVPFESTTEEQEDYFPPNNYHDEARHEHVSESSTHTQRIPSTPAVNTKATSQEHEQVQQANTKVHRYTTSKHRYKKPTRYQTTPKASISTEQTGVPEAPSSEFIDEVISSTTSTLRPRRKRKRTKAPLVAEKHNLDVPELKEAFETGRDREQSDELTAHASTIKENIEPPRHQGTSKIQKITNFSPSHSWNPMRIRTRPSSSSPTSSSSTTTTSQRGQRTSSANDLRDLKNIEVISIQKSHSHSYYAGTEAPVKMKVKTTTAATTRPTKRTRKMTSRADAIQMATVSTTPNKPEHALKPTRGLVIDTTYFKVKDNSDEDFYDGTGKLPKNHKLF